jgi:hypothetical protein
MLDKSELVFDLFLGFIVRIIDSFFSIS